jgi:hypothetical protein
MHLLRNGDGMAQLMHMRKDDDPNAGVLLLNLVGVSKHSLCGVSSTTDLMLQS